MNLAAPLSVEWPEGNSGCAGVPAGNESSHGFHDASASKLPNVTAVMGRQSTYRYFASQHAIPASDSDIFSSANKCAFSDNVKCRAAAASDAIRIQKSEVLPAQNSASSES